VLHLIFGSTYFYVVWSTIVDRPNIGIFYIVIDKDSPVHLLDKAPEGDTTELEQDILNLPGTPEVASPDQSGFKTGPDDQDPNSRLVNQLYQSWGVISNSSVTATLDGFKVGRSLASGYLIDGNKSVTSIYIQEATRSCNIKELMNMYHGLGILTRSKYIDECLPWHLAVTKRSHDGLERAMPRGDIS
jgi:hypothetical protein